MAVAAGAEEQAQGKPEQADPGLAAVDLAAGAGDDDDVDSEAGDSLITFDHAALEEAQRLATSLSEAGAAVAADEEERKKKQRGGCKEDKKRRKKQRREDDIVRAKQAGLAVPSLKDLLAAASAAPAAASAGAGTSASSASGAAVPSVASTPADNAATAAVAAPAAVAAGELAAAATVAAEAPAVAPSPAAEAAAKRLAKEAARRQKVSKALNARTVFVTNLPFKATDKEIEEWLGVVGKVKSVRLSKDKATSKSLGYAHVQFESSESVDAAIEKCDRFDVQGRVLRVARVGRGERCQFDLPQELKDDILALIREAYEGKNISTIKDAWQKRHPGQKLDTSKYGFKNFSAAMHTLEGLTLEHHVEKSLTFLAFLTGSAAHTAFLEEQVKKKAEAVVAAAAKAEADAVAAANAAAAPASTEAAAASSAPVEGQNAEAAPAAELERKRPLEEGSKEDVVREVGLSDEPPEKKRRAEGDDGEDKAISAASGAEPPADAVMA